MIMSRRHHLLERTRRTPLAGQRVVGEELSHPGGGFFLLPLVAVVILVQPGEDVGVEPDRKPLRFQVGDRSIVGLLLEACLFSLCRESAIGKLSWLFIVVIFFLY